MGRVKLVSDSSSSQHFKKPPRIVYTRLLKCLKQICQRRNMLKFWEWILTIVWYSSANFQGDSYCWVKYVLSLTLLPFSFFGLMDSSPLQGALEWTWGRFFFSELKGWRGTSNHWGHCNQSKGPDESLLFWE